MFQEARRGARRLCPEAVVVELRDEGQVAASQAAEGGHSSRVRWRYKRVKMPWSGAPCDVGYFTLDLWPSLPSPQACLP